jgi:pimeloyl-ACP methyl ester carboxylesterase
MLLRSIFAALTLCAAAGAASAQTTPQPPASPAPTASPTPGVVMATIYNRPDYAQDSLWLCKPGIANDRCHVNLDATVIRPNGTTRIERFRAASNPKIDCFFVYPTVSMDPGFQSDWTPDRMEFDDVKLQFARFRSVCRTFAPLYRQATLTALRAASGGPTPSGERPPPNQGGYQDVVDAWNWYMAHENHGRGVVLIGHSQGAGLVARLLANEIEGKPAQRQLVSAIVLGSSVLVPDGQDVGGTYRTIPLCRAESQVGCVISYSSFRDTNPPPATSRFGRAREGQVAACTNPANLASGSGTNDSYFLTQGFLNGSGGTTQPAWANPAPRVTTPFVKVPGLISTSCVKVGDFSYLQMHVNADPADRRTDQVAGEIQRATGPDLSWGLHLIDVDHSMGDLLRIVRAQAAAYSRNR